MNDKCYNIDCPVLRNKCIDDYINNYGEYYVNDVKKFLSVNKNAIRTACNENILIRNPVVKVALYRKYHLNLYNKIFVNLQKSNSYGSLLNNIIKSYQVRKIYDDDSGSYELDLTESNQLKRHNDPNSNVYIELEIKCDSIGEF